MLRKALVALMSLMIVPVACMAAPTGSDEAFISQLLHGMFDKPQEPLSVEPILVSGKHAVADWAQGEMGGRALLRNEHGSWRIILCAGDGIKTRDALARAGVPLADAERLEKDLSSAEARLPPEKAAMFSRFEGIAMMNGDTDQHKPAHGSKE
ncbi:copper uptake system-associated protein [Bradyrhizobium ontarionense]|uniref:Copper uptake system-associated protein n=1 Tax=Bradyrhizobium ontarionense TaxID=2898149 RepID=A0ABY3R6U6_9BRAD|nr:copper uptake system-associated protein [Bradyrhizobium sp. A19]UFZ02742.1 copper uptake system-associated protein [Bradyrhizobium sp. A19]